MKKIIIVVVTFAVGFFGFQYAFSKIKTDKIAMEDPNKKTDASDWVSLFDGKTFNGWHNYLTKDISDEWQVRNGAMVFTPDPDKKHGINNLVTDKEYTNFKLSIEWKISEGGNSGIFWGVFEDKKYAQPYLTGAEVQVLDNDGHPDGKKENHRAGSLYDMIAPSKLVVNPIGEWNTCILEINHKTNSGKIWLNNEHIVSFPVNGPEWDKLVKKSKFKNWKAFGKYKTGRIGLQDHGNKVSYRNIKIKEL